MFTRKEYLDSASNEVSRHHEYYSQFVIQETVDNLLRSFGRKAIEDSTDEHFNDLPLRIWDNLPLYKSQEVKLREAGDFPTLCGKVCIYKAAAESIRASK